MRTHWMEGIGLEFVFDINYWITHASEAESESTRAKSGQESFPTFFFYFFSLKKKIYFFKYKPLIKDSVVNMGYSDIFSTTWGRGL